MSIVTVRPKLVLVVLFFSIYSYGHEVISRSSIDFVYTSRYNESSGKSYIMVESDAIEGPDLTSIDPPTFNTSSVRPMIHFGLGGGDYSFTALGVSVFRQINPCVTAGISVHYFGENGRNVNFSKWQKIPITLETIMDLKKYKNNRSSLYFKIGAGYSLTLNGSYYDPNENIQKKVTNGWIVNPGIGYRFNILQNTGLNFDMSYNLIVDELENENGEAYSKNYWNHILFRTSVFF